MTHIRPFESSIILAKGLCAIRSARFALLSRGTTSLRYYAAMASRAQAPPFSRSELEDLLKRRFFYSIGFQLYGGVAGLYDYGPPGCALQANVVDIWRKHFVLEEDMLEVDCTALTPAEVLKTSGHVEKFADWMCKDPATGEIFRADHIVEEVLEARLKGDKEARGEKTEDKSKEDTKRKKKVKQITVNQLDDETVALYEEILAKIDGYDGSELAALIKNHNIRNPATDTPLDPPQAFNLMFGTSIGPSGGIAGYLRPETAQGQFLNFNKLLEFNNLRMPFASASIGKSFRNEISPRSGLLRVREFLLAEIEHFIDPKIKTHPRFEEVKDVSLPFLPRSTQLQGKTTITTQTIGDAVASKMVDNETLGYYMVRINHFLLKIGINPQRLRFRQHLANEMAHYAADCWDAELETSYGWIECVGCADRSAYDLTVHSARTNTSLVVREQLEKPIRITAIEPVLDKKKFGPHFKKSAKAIEDMLIATTQREREEFLSKGMASLSLDGENVMISGELCKWEHVTRKENTREYTPSVIEPSFGIGRILYAVLEHAFWARPDDNQRGVLSLPPQIAPVKCLLVPLSATEAFKPIIRSLSLKLRKLGISNKIDDSSTAIGRRYARNDELGTPFGITVDFQTVQDSTITLRERDSTKQIRASDEDILSTLKELIEGTVTWEETRKKWGDFEGQVLDK